jgi:hypothetical protein
MEEDHLSIVMLLSLESYEQETKKQWEREKQIDRDLQYALELNNQLNGEQDNEGEIETQFENLNIQNQFDIQNLRENNFDDYENLSLLEKIPTPIPNSIKNKLIPRKCPPSLLKEECCICQEEYTENDKVYILPCSHAHHKTCLDDWLKEKKSCPICRREIDF